MYHHVFVAGTFDRLHKGHESLLQKAFEVGDYVTIGLTSDQFVLTYKKDSDIQPFSTRKQQLVEWLAQKNITKYSIIAIDDPYEPAASDPEGEVLVVTPDTKARGEEINEMRKNKGLAPYALLVVPLVPAQDGNPIASTRVRNGEIDQAGRLMMPDALRPTLAKPLSSILTGDDIGTSIENNRSGIIISVGDMTTKTLFTAGVVPNLIIVDFQVGRKPFLENDVKLAELSLFRIAVKSGPGFIAQEACGTIQKWAKHPAEKMILAVDGEEDLLTLPAVAYGPLSSVVYYGQPEKGLVEVIVTGERKNEAIALLTQFVVE